MNERKQYLQLIYLLNLIKHLGLSTFIMVKTLVEYLGNRENRREGLCLLCLRMNY